MSVRDSNSSPTAVTIGYSLNFPWYNRLLSERSVNVSMVVRDLLKVISSLTEYGIPLTSTNEYLGIVYVLGVRASVPFAINASEGV